MNVAASDRWPASIDADVVSQDQQIQGVAVRQKRPDPSRRRCRAA